MKFFLQIFPEEINALLRHGKNKGQKTDKSHKEERNKKATDKLKQFSITLKHQ